MTPLPKKKHTKSRSGKRARTTTNVYSLPSLVKCPSCGELKYSHRICQNCGNYHGRQSKST